MKAPSAFGAPESSAPAEKVDPNAFEFREPEAKTVGSGYDAKKLKKLTPEEKARRKLKWNVIMGATGVGILAIVVLILKSM